MTRQFEQYSAYTSMPTTTTSGTVTSNRTTELLPCPFCGGEIPAPTRKYMSVLICPTCNAYGPGNSDMTNDELIAAWNTRADYHGYEQAAIEAWESIKAWNTSAMLGEQTAGVAEKIEELRRTSLAFPPNIRRKVNIALNGIEQAIAATLDDEDYERKMDALLCRLTNGKFSKSRSYDLDFMESCVNEEFEQLYAEELADTMLGHGNLTAEQVREAIERHFGKVAVLDDGKPVEWRDDWVCKVGIDYRGIADELNATLGSGTCKNVSKYAKECNHFKCSECGCAVEDAEGYYVSVHGKNWEHQLPWSFCPNCGKAVKR